MKVIGFTSSRNVPSKKYFGHLVSWKIFLKVWYSVEGWHYMGPTEMVVSDPRDSEASAALSALIRALAETEAVMIVRYVKKKGSAPQLGCLTPRKRNK